MRFISTMICVLALSTLACASEQRSFLRSNDVITCIGDSITAQGVYEDYLQQALDTAYPGAHIRVMNHGVGGQTAGAAANLLAESIAADKPTIALVMFGVNDTRWSTGDAENKEAAYRNGLEKVATLAKAQQIPLIFLRETHFSHGAQSDEWTAGINAMLMRLFSVQDQFAAEQQIPIIDVHGAYQRALSAAWAKDPSYELTPDIVHPTQPGHAAMVAEIMRAMGVGLPLADGAMRGPLQSDTPSAVSITPIDDCGLLDAANTGTINISVKVSNLTAKALKGEVFYILGTQKGAKTVKLSPNGCGQLVALPIRVADLPQGAGIMPCYIGFRADGLFTACETLWYSSPSMAAAQQPHQFADTDFQLPVGTTTRKCPVSQVAALRRGNTVMVDFTWNDENRVPAQTGFKNRYGTVIDTLLDLNARDLQPCDAVELLFDPRPLNAIGRFTSNVDANPQGTARVGICVVDDAGKLTPKALAQWNLPGQAELSLKEIADNRYRLQLVMPPVSLVGFSMHVTDVDKFQMGDGVFFRLTGKQGVIHEPMTYALLGTNKAQRFYRVGY